MSVRTVRHFIDNAFVDAVEGGSFPSVSPIDNQQIAEVAEGTRADAARAVEAARRAFDEGPWPRMSPAERKRYLHRIADGIDARLDELARWETLDMGKPITESKTRDIPRSAFNFRFFADYAEHLSTRAFDQRAAGIFSYELREPLGVVAAISPWNFPLMLLTWKVAPALAFGCTVVAKPAEQSPITASILAEIAAEADLPPGVFNLIQGFGPDAAGQELTEHPGVDAVTFTGESATGRLIMANAARTLKKLSFELGGKSANIVCADADLEAALDGTVTGSFGNQGEVCLAGTRLLVQHPIYDEFVARYVERAEAMKVGDPRDPETQMGPLVTQEHMDKVLSYVDLAVEEGGTIRTGGRRLSEGDLGKGNYVAPTIVTDVRNEMRVCQEEIFGPVEMVMAFDELDEAIAIANQTRYGLAGMVWTTNLATAHRVAREVRNGTMWVNCYFVRDLRAPFGGYKDSGIGREGGDYSYEFFTESKAVVMKLA